MPSGIGDFSVTTGVPPAPRGGASGTPEPSSRFQSTDSGAGGSWRHFVCVVPPDFGLEKAVHGNTLEMTAFQSDFRLSVALDGLELPDGISFGASIAFTLGMEQVSHPEKILDGQPFLHVFREAVRLLDRCLGRKLSRPEFLSALNRVGLPTAWRNELADGVFTAALPDIGAPFAADAAEKFIAEVGNSGTGFVLNEAGAKNFRDGLAELLADLERSVLEHPRARGPLGLVNSLHTLLKRMRGPKRLHFHLLPASMSEPEYRAHWENALAEHPGRIAAWIYPATGAAETDPSFSAWKARFPGVPAFLSLEDADDFIAENHG